MFVYKARNNILEIISIIQLERSRCILFLGSICMVIISTMRIVFFIIFQETQITFIQISQFIMHMFHIPDVIGKYLIRIPHSKLFYLAFYLSAIHINMIPFSFKYMVCRVSFNLLHSVYCDLKKLL